MSDEELGGIEAAAKRLGERGMPNVASDLLKLIAEVRRLKAENRALQSRLDLAEGRVEGIRKVSLEYIGKMPPSVFTEDDL